MKALSVQQPWASLIVHGHKSIEFRSWATRHRGPLLICSSARPRIILDDGTALPCGQALAVVDVVDCRPFGKRGDLTKACMDGQGSKLADLEGQAWVLENIRVIEPFPVKGKLNLFEVSHPSLTEYEVG